MKFVDYLYDTDGCGCNNLLRYDDIQLQGVFENAISKAGTSYQYTVNVFVYGLDGASLLADVTADFTAVVYSIPNTNKSYVNIYSKRFNNVMCNNKCFRLKVEVKATYSFNLIQNTAMVFSYFSDCMTVDNCCVTVRPSGIIIKTVANELG